MKAKIALMIVAIAMIGTTAVSAREIPTSFWNLPLLVRPGVDDLKATVGNVLDTNQFKPHTNFEGDKITVGHGQSTYDGKTFVFPVMFLKDGNAEATFTFFITNEGKYAYLSKVLVVNNTTNSRLTLKNYREKLQGIFMFEELLRQ